MYRGGWRFSQAFDTKLTCLAATNRLDGIVIGAEDGTLRLFNVQTGVYLRLGRAGDPAVTCVAAANADKYVCARRDGTLQVWDLASPCDGAATRTDRRFGGLPITGIEQAADDQMLVQCGDAEYEWQP